MSVQFDADGAGLLLKQHLMAAMKQLQGEFLRDAQSHMRTPEGAGDLTEGDITDVAGVIAAEVVGGAWVAMDVWGRGSLMAGTDQNPMLDQYRASNLWNPARHDTTIRGRPAGGYTNIFGEERVSTGKRAGKNLENAPSGTFAPQPPSFALQTAARWLENGRMQEVLQAVLQDFPWDRFVIVGG